MLPYSEHVSSVDTRDAHSARNQGIRCRVWVLPVAWFIFVVVTGFYADTYVVLPGAMAALSTALLVMSLHRWQHLLALPLYAFFGLEVFVMAYRIILVMAA